MLLDISVSIEYTFLVEKQIFKTDFDPKTRLAPPGAGLPFHQRIMLRWYVFPFIAKNADPGLSAKSFNVVYKKILESVKGLTEKQLNQKVLVPPQIGLEDSSRYWSIAMTLDHLLIVGKQIEKGVIELSNGRAIPVKVDIAKVKPTEKNSAEDMVNEFENFITESPHRIVEGAKNWESTMTHFHPWFGPFPLKGWYWLLGAHGGIHLKQIRAIKKQLDLNKS